MNDKWICDSTAFLLCLIWHCITIQCWNWPKRTVASRLKRLSHLIWFAFCFFSEDVVCKTKRRNQLTTRCSGIFQPLYLHVTLIRSCYYVYIFSCMSFLSCRNVWNFAHALKFKADFYSQMSVCRHKLGELPPQPPGNSNPHTIDKRFAHYTKKKVCIMYLVRRRSTAVRGRLLHRTVAASVAVTGDDVMIAGYSPSGSPWLGIMIGCVCWCKPVPTLYHWRHSDVQ